MRKFFILIIMAVLLAPLSAQASIYGVLKGKVVDTEGKPVIGASVLIEGTTRGTNVRDKNGNFTIVNINAGEYNVRVRAVGFDEFVAKVRISADQTSEISVTLRETGVTTGTVVVTMDRPMVEKTAIGKSIKISGEEITNVAREGVQGIVGLSAGVFSAGSGFNIRGSRSTETQIRFNGLDIGNQFTGGLGGAGNDYFPMVSAFATEEVQVLTGGFSAEYGEALGGVVNTVPRTGRTTHYDGFLRFRTDVDPLWGRQGSGMKIGREDNRVKIIHAGEGLKLQGPGLMNFEGGIGGPLPLLNNSTFYLSTVNKYEKYQGSGGYERYDPDGMNIGKSPNNQIWVKNITPNLKFSLTNDISLLVGGFWGLASWEGSSFGWRYATTEGALFDEDGKIIPGATNGVPVWKAKLPVVNNHIYNAMARINHSLSGKSFYEFTVSFNKSDEMSGRRANYNDPDFFGGFSIMTPRDEMMALGDKLVPGKDFILDDFTFLTSNQKTKDGYLEFDMPAVNPLTGYIEGPSHSQVTNNPWGIIGISVANGNATGFSMRNGSYLQLDGSYTSNFDHDGFDHIFKAGFEVRFFTMHRHSNGAPWDGNAFRDIYTDMWGGNIYADNDTIRSKTSSPFNSKKYSGYVQDQISYKGIIFSPGLRFDLFDPSSRYRLEANKNFVSIRADSGFGDASMKFQISPRLNIAYPITERSKVAISYGLYFKTPELQNLYDNYAVDVLRGNNLLGNPNMEAQRTNQYQVEYLNQIADDFSFDVTAYYKDIYNQIGIVYIPAVPDPYYQYTVSEYGNAKGIEFGFRKLRRDNFGFSVNYSLAQVVGTASSSGSNYNPATDPFTGIPMYPLAEYPLSYDIRHRINPVIDFFWLEGEGPSIGGIHLLENMNINLSGFFQSGTPYTRMDVNQKPLSEINAERNPSIWNVDLRLTKAFNLKAWFGEGMNKATLEFFVDVTNLLNRTEATRYWPYTGSADDDGVSIYREKGSFVLTPHYKEANYGMAETFRTDQYDQYGTRMYSPKADFDNNGVVTQEERYQSYMNYLEMLVAGRQNYQSPRRVFVGVLIRF